MEKREKRARKPKPELNVFEKRIKTLKQTAVLAGVLLPLGVAAAIAVGVTGNIVDDTRSIIFFVFAVLAAALALPSVIMAFVMIPLYRYQLRTAQTLLSDAEIMEIKRPMELNLAIAGKAMRLLKEGKRTGDMAAFNEFRDIVMMTRSVAMGYARYIV